MSLHDDDDDAGSTGVATDVPVSSLQTVWWAQAEMAEGLNGCIPQVRNPAIMLAGDTAALHACENSELNWKRVMTRPGFCCR